ncbi:archaellum component FlaF (FlaF/FlaG flagellin family) [Anaerosolibacter carboniphilus]|uniref:Archaellum component FlaF (FlaF/FlaG flagellin family) n=1 Tax=Anaerosolibacter carboniphilus TaxID=1417629 RepID=A0A841KSR1_9FIRM|nr:stalk domain-containing protein [Anaerosolibacter carboniphilus]MBB6216457.1 archaellum component FlaF (FlaF/FlaG flagellin family) [Anaerosolibacter carboniphilus]
MTIQRKLILLFALFIFTSTPVVAVSMESNTTNTNFSEINVSINGEFVQNNFPVLNFNDEILLPLNAIADSINGAIEWNSETKTINIIKPEVTMIFAKNADYEDGIYTLGNFSNKACVHVKDFYVYTAVSNLNPGEYHYRMVLLDPDKEIVSSSEEFSVQITDDIPQLIDLTQFTNINFTKVGNHKVQIQMKVNGSFKTLYETTLLVFQD